MGWIFKDKIERPLFESVQNAFVIVQNGWFKRVSSELPPHSEAEKSIFHRVLPNFRRCLDSIRRFAPHFTRHDRRCLSVPGVLGFMMRFTFAATPVKGIRTRKRRLTIYHPISIPDTPRLATHTLVVSTGSRHLSGGVEKPQGW
mgnify:CR=1 FL=1